MANLLTYAELRRLIGFSMDAMASFLGISKSMLSMIEIGKRSLNMPALGRMVIVRDILTAPSEMVPEPETEESIKAVAHQNLLSAYRQSLQRLEAIGEKEKASEEVRQNIRKLLRSYDRLSDPAFDARKDQHFKELLELEAKPPSGNTYQSKLDRQLEMEALHYKINRLETM
jgi:transcriptional regulator with XRE-family HTH domain